MLKKFCARATTWFITQLAEIIITRPGILAKLKEQVSIDALQALDMHEIKDQVTINALDDVNISAITERIAEDVAGQIDNNDVIEKAAEELAENIDNDEIIKATVQQIDSGIDNDDIITAIAEEFTTDRQFKRVLVEKVLDELNGDAFYRALFNALIDAKADEQSISPTQVMHVIIDRIVDARAGR